MLVGQLVKDTFDEPVWTILVRQVKDYGVRSVNLQHVISFEHLYRQVRYTYCLLEFGPGV
jgi:hypothetical protein